MPSPQSGGSLKNYIFLVGLGRLFVEVPGGKGLHHLSETGGSPRIGSGALGFFTKPGEGVEAGHIFQAMYARRDDVFS